MRAILSRLKQLISGPGAAPVENPQEIRRDFKERYFNFRQLITANTSALEGFAEIERLLTDPAPFGMSVVRANVTAVLVSVYRMIRKMDKLAPGKYPDLKIAYNRISEQITAGLDHAPGQRDNRLIITMSDIDSAMSDSVGQKMANLGELKNRLGLDVPDGFVMTAQASDVFFRENSLETEINRQFKTRFSEDIAQLHALSTDIQNLILASPLPGALARQITAAVTKIADTRPKGLRFALRSSALGEDTLDASFAGQYKTLLNVKPSDVSAAYKEILAAKYSATAIQYRLNRGFKDEDIDMCVGCIAMVDAASGGVAYTRHPFDIRDDAVYIQSTWGLPKAVVDGSVNCDLFVVDRGQPPRVRHQEVQTKEKKFICYADEGECRFDFLDEMQSQPSLTQAQMSAIARYALKIEAHYGTPQDIEWALVTDETAGDCITLLQSRPLKQLRVTPDKAVFPDHQAGDDLVAAGGITASPGVAAGPVCTVASEADLTRFPRGAVLVAKRALPRWAPLLGRASGLVTEKGSFAGHLANVAREFGVPAIFGIPDACEVLRSHDMVTLDADNCKIYKGEIPALLATRQAPKNMMAGSPVHTTLSDISRHILTLNLLDPDASEFRAKNCTTLHDITRFIHEKSVAEMFSFGKNHGFDEVASKQLHDQVPMQWWVMNLDDGFKDSITGRYVYLTDICCVPMLAVWEGIVAVPWEGPPPLDKKGMMSVMFEATANTALNTGVRTRYSQRNYFMISKHYCCLNSRLGFHFTTLEAYVGTRDSENYISFRFQGGAANQDRRLKRVRLIRDFLTGYGFNVTIKKDHLNARIKGGDADTMTGRLKILGYLSIHTRQLDMVTTNQALVNRYYQKFKYDIESVFGIPMDAQTKDQDTGEHQDDG